MQVFKLYVRRLLKHKLLIASMIVLPLLITYITVQVVQPSNTQQFAHMMNGLIGLLMMTTLFVPMLFYDDKKNATDRRILLSTYSVFRYYCQVIAVFLMISIIQFMAIVIFAKMITKIQFPFTVLEHGIIMLAFILLNSIAIAFGLIIMYTSQSRQSSLIKLITFGLIFVVLGGLLMPNELLPFFVQNVAIILPTSWLSEVVGIVLEGSEKHMRSLTAYIIGLLTCAVVIMVRLTHTKIERI